jgi:hypothetical protein
MKLGDLIELMERLDLGEPGQARRPPRENLDHLRDAVARGLDDPEFRLDCIQHDLDAWKRWEESGWTGMKPALRRMPDLGFFLMMFYWPPGEVSPPHEHTSWTMSSMFHHRLDVMTYDWNTAVTERKLVKRSLFTAVPGPVGYIYDPAIHSPRNTTDRGAVSFHIYNSDDGPILEKQHGPIEGLETYDKSSTTASPPPRPPSLFLRVRQEVLRCHAESAQRFPCAQTMAMLETLYGLGDAATRDVVGSAMIAVDAAGAEATLARLRAGLAEQA